MIITPIKTEKVLARQISLEKLLDASLKKFPEKSILVITSKIVSLCEGRTESLNEDKEKLMQREADYYLPKKFRRFGASGTITHFAFIGASGIDESNASGQYVLLPKNSQKTVDVIYQYLKKRFNVKEAGVIITDSHSTPLRRGASGISLAYRGFIGLKDYRGKEDLFGRKLVMEQANVADALASSAVLVMGEGSEQTPLALIKDIPNVTFQDNAPTKKERSEFFVDLKDDIFAPLFNLKRLKKGAGK
ncbi:MAG: coenzyme F420-0:L-glutamate ligase [Candidatus Moraniibacteriota bacterium]